MNPDDYYKALSAELKTFEDQVLEMKNKQPSGNNAIKTYENTTGDTWDIDWTPTWVGPQTEDGIDKSVQFRADDQASPFSNLRYEILINNSVWYTINDFSYHPQNAAITGSGYDSFLVYAGLTPEPGLQGWYFAISAYTSGMNIKVRFIVDSTDTGAVSVHEVAF